MKKITFVNKPLKSKKFPKDFTYADLVLICLDNPPAQGIKISEMAERIAVYNTFKIAKRAPSIQVTKEEITTILLLIQDMKWTVIDAELVNFFEYLQSLQN